MYNKLFTKILDSSIWLEPDHTRLVWLTLLAAMDEDGVARFASVANLAHRAIVPLKAAQKAVTALESDDPNSADPDHGGRRIERIDGGWVVLNAEKYRELVTREVQRQQTKERVRRYRLRNAAVTQGNDLVTPSEADTEADTEAEEERGADAPPPSALMDLWNTETASPLPRCRGLSKARTAQARIRLAEQPISYWRELYQQINASPFLRGENDRGWRASFDWILKPENVLKVLEGKYDGAARGTPGDKTAGNEDAIRAFVSRRQS